MEPRQGQEVIVYDRNLFTVPVRGVINNISNDDGALKVTFYPNNPGGSNLTQHNGKYFLREQCRGINGELFYAFVKATPEELHTSEYYNGAREKEARKEYKADVAKALRCADAGNAYHWPTVAAILADEVKRLKTILSTAEGQGVKTNENHSD